MKEIKFRAYDEESQKIYQITDINFSDYSANGVCCGEWKEFSTNNLLQYTGLKDRNGVEIYSGDILKFKYTSSDYKKAYIEWNEEKASYDFVDNETKLNYSYNFRQINNIEVIGNVYEHKHLVE